MGELSKMKSAPWLIPHFRNLVNSDEFHPTQRVRIVKLSSSSAAALRLIKGPELGDTALLHVPYADSAIYLNVLFHWDYPSAPPSISVSSKHHPGFSFHTDWDFGSKLQNWWDSLDPNSLKDHVMWYMDQVKVEMVRRAYKHKELRTVAFKTMATDEDGVPDIGSFEGLANSDFFLYEEGKRRGELVVVGDFDVAAASGMRPQPLGGTEIRPDAEHGESFELTFKWQDFGRYDAHRPAITLRLTPFLAAAIGAAGESPSERELGTRKELRSGEGLGGLASRINDAIEARLEERRDKGVEQRNVMQILCNMFNKDIVEVDREGSWLTTLYELEALGVRPASLFLLTIQLDDAVKMSEIRFRFSSQQRFRKPQGRPRLSRTVDRAPKKQLPAAMYPPPQDDGDAWISFEVKRPDSLSEPLAPRPDDKRITAFRNKVHGAAQTFQRNASAARGPR